MGNTCDGILLFAGPFFVWDHLPNQRDNWNSMSRLRTDACTRLFADGAVCFILSNAPIVDFMDCVCRLSCCDAVFIWKKSKRNDTTVGNFVHCHVRCVWISYGGTVSKSGANDLWQTGWNSAVGDRVQQYQKVILYSYRKCRRKQLEKQKLCDKIKKYYTKAWF